MHQEILRIDEEIFACMDVNAAAREAAEISIKPLIMDDLPTILFDRKGLARIFQCIFDNAIKFTDPGGRIWIAARELEDGDLEIRIKDTGSGISEEMLFEVLKPFRQADGSRARRFEGVGLGLAMANSIAKLHNSRIDIESQEGVGTTVILLIPSNRVVVDAGTADGTNGEKPNKTDENAIAA